MAFVVRSVSRHAKLRRGLLMNPKTVKKALKDAIQAITDYKWLFPATACETIITNLDASAFPLHDIKRLYVMRWGIETSFRNLKHTLGLLHLHAKKVEFVLQEIFAKLTMYNFCELITQSVVIRQAQKTHTYKVNFSDAVHICRQFFLGDVPPPILEAMLMRYISPIRPGRKDTRKLTQKSSASFTYRVA